MAFPHSSNGGSGSAILCADPGCSRPPVASASLCRIHLAPVLRSNGVRIGFDDPELAGLMAAAVHLARHVVAGLPEQQLAPSERLTGLDMYALLEPDDEWAIAQACLDLLGTCLSDERPFGGMVLSAPSEFKAKVLLRLQVTVPAAAEEVLRPRLESAMAAMIREAVGPDTPVPIAVEPAEEDG